MPLKKAIVKRAIIKGTRKTGAKTRYVKGEWLLASAFRCLSDVCILARTRTI